MLPYVKLAYVLPSVSSTRPPLGYRLLLFWTTEDFSRLNLVPFLQHYSIPPNVALPRVQTIAGYEYLFSIQDAE